MERVRLKETVFLETSDALFLLVHNYAGLNFIGQYSVGHLRLKINCIVLSIPMVNHFFFLITNLTIVL